MRFSIATALLLTALSASATTIVLPTDEQLVDKSPLVVQASVVSSKVVDLDGAIWTETDIAVERLLKGTGPARITIRESGGALPDRITKIYGTPEYRAGERVLAFLTPTPRGDFQTVDMFVGAFVARSAVDGRMLWVRTRPENVVLLDAQFEPVASPDLPRDAERFERFIGERVAGRFARKDYTVEAAAVKQPARPGQSADFELIDTERLYRWFAFDTGGSAQWFSHGTQPGYSEGGIAEVRTAMAAWTGYSGAKIRYTYAGVMSGAPAGLSRRNNVNEILLDDPLAEIAGTWSASSGGVVGKGGFNGVSSGGTWTAPFAGAGYAAGPVHAYNIVEGNLVIQDGVSPSARISSNRLAEIISHELGHTLGFGHSADASALMYFTVSGIGPQLRADDELAARWLYPSGGAVAPGPVATRPAAPAGLTGTVSGTSVSLRWTDNSSNETGFNIYVATGSGAFNRAGDVAAGSQSATVSNVPVGSARIYVAAFNAAGESAASNTVTVSIAPPPAPLPLVAAFSFYPSAPTTNDTVSFADASTGGVTSWSWNFGDGSTSQQQNPLKRYTTAGSYNVTLTVYRNSETRTTSRRVDVVAPLPATPDIGAAFDFSPPSPQVGQTVSFVDRSTGGASRWSWSFGDGGSAAVANPTHVFAAPGVYTVTLTASNGGSTASSSRPVTVQAIAPFRALVSAAAQTGGAGGSFWRTELTLFNAGDNAANVDLIFIPNSGSPMSRSAVIAPRESRTWTNSLPEIFGLGNGAGAIAIEATSQLSTPLLRVASRTFTSGTGGTYGLAVPGVQTRDLHASTYLTGIRSDATFRTNLGLVNRGNAPLGAALELLDGNGSVVGRSNVVLAAKSFQQNALISMFPQLEGRSPGVLSLRITAAAPDAVSVYASVVDNLTQDPTFVQAVPAPGEGRVVVPAVARSQGANGTFWRSDVALFNPSASAIGVNLRYLPAAQDNRGAAARWMSVPAGGTLTVADVVNAMGVASGSGALEVTWAGANGPVVSSRTYTPSPAGGTYGQAIDPVAQWGSDSYVTGLRSDADFRSNVGFVNGANATIGVTVRLLAASGSVLGTGFVELAPQSQLQVSLAALFPGINAAAAGSVTLHAQSTAEAKLFVYGSMVDNASGDPVYFAGN